MNIEYPAASVEVVGCGDYTLEVVEDPDTSPGSVRIDLQDILSEEDIQLATHHETLIVTGPGPQLTTRWAGGSMQQEIQTHGGAVVDATQLGTPVNLNLLPDATSDEVSATSRQRYNSGLVVEEGVRDGWKFVRRYFETATGVLRIRVGGGTVVWIAGHQGEPIYA